MCRCCDREFKDKKSFLSHIRSSEHHFLTLSDSFLTDLPFQYLTSVIQDKERVVRALGFTLVEGKALIPLHTDKGAVGGVLKRSLLGEVRGPSVEG